MDSYGSVLVGLGQRARQLRIFHDLRQTELAARAGLAAGTVQRFERTGRASLENVLRIAMVLGVDADLERMFAPPPYRTLDEALARPAVRQRVRLRRRK